MKIKDSLFNQNPDDTGGGAGGSGGNIPIVPGSGGQGLAGPSMSGGAGGIMGEGLSFRENWFNDVKEPAFDEFRSMAAQFKDLPTVFKALKDSRTAFSQRQEGMIKLPGEKATPEEIKAYRAATGVPETADKYAFKIPPLPGGVQIAESDIKAFSDFAHKNGIPQAQAQAMLEFQVGLEASEISSIEAAEAKHMADSTQKLRDEWGMKFDTNLLLAQRAAKTFGVSESDAKNPELLRIMARVAGAISEDKLASPGELGGILSAGNEATDIVKNDRNPLHQIYWDTSHPRNAEVVAMVLQKRKEQTQRGG